MHSTREFAFQGRVYFGDTDAAGVVYHAKYLYFLEAARIELLDELGCSYDSLIKQGIGLSPVEIQLNYHAPLRFNDLYRVVTKFNSASGASFVLGCKIFCGDKLTCSGTVKLACIDETTWKPRRLPKQISELLSNAK
jgi:acyl-CoA thioester hydrolase